ncbi:MAG: peptidyl-tRNA hydrolase-like protein 2, mitochondrial precursor (Bcl-2 inhibitor of transcription 1) [Monoraphidium minutum]|nr:MAG: peptidyl-tRNA hydrolase-like protein 2, mitochondrial precursor (Bcl-2 inhibitor of transcription 1) [Monoraphidium minutum]
MQTTGVLPSLIKFLGGVAVGWVLKTFASSGSASGGSGGASSGAKKKKRRGVAVGQPKLLVPRPREELKMVLCVNNSLGMGKGKIGAQCAHAAVGVMGRFRARHELMFKQWEACGQPKIALKVKDEEEMASLAARAQAAGLCCYIVHDAGRTQIAAGSQTVLAVGPAPKSEVDKVTGHLSLM